MDYPYYIIPDIEALPHAKGDERQRLVRRIAALVGDPVVLRRILGLDPEEFSSFYPDLLPPEPDTTEVIDTFIDKFGDPKAARSAEVKQVEELVPLPPADYDLNSIEASPLITDQGQPDSDEDPTAALLSTFLPETKTEKQQTQPPQLSESLARAMIKNGNYTKALEIITDLSLKNPKKSIYFADQIRFLKKLILNQSKQNGV